MLLTPRDYFLPSFQAVVIGGTDPRMTKRDSARAKPSGKELDPG